uniref:Uncharacterized protein n=1 Tax=Anguilla anguilla TaxID=7936 RepID=A0A0E9TQQ2_ANGAN
MRGLVLEGRYQRATRYLPSSTNPRISPRRLSQYVIFLN